MRLLACLIVAPQRGYDEPAILSYAISSFCPTSADGLHSRVADGVHQKQPATGGLGSPHEPGGAGLDELLRAVLPLEVRSGAPSYQRGSRALGATEIQAVQTPGTSIDALAGKHRATGPQSVRPVAARRATGGWRVGAG